MVDAKKPNKDEKIVSIDISYTAVAIQGFVITV